MALLFSRRAASGGAPSRSAALCVVIVAVSVVSLGLASSASAAKSRGYTGLSFGPDGAAGAETFQNLQGLAFDETDGSVLALDLSGSGAIYKFDSAGAPSNFSALGANHIDGVGGAAGLAETEIAVAPIGSPGGTEGFIYLANNTSSITVFESSGAKLGELAIGEETCGVATDPEGHVFVGSYPSTIREYTPSAGLVTAGDKTGESTGVVSEICNVAADGLGNVYAASFNGTTLTRLEGIADTEATAAAPAGAPIAVESGSNSVYVDRGDHVSVLGPAGESEGEFGSGQFMNSLGVAVDSGTEEVYVADRGTGTIKVFGPPITFPTTEPASAIRTEAATLNGTVFPEGRQYVGCRFEYGLESTAAFEHEIECEPEAAHIPADSGPHAVTASLGNLAPDSNYKFRVIATNSAGTAEGQTLKFATVGQPRITDVLARNADQHSATLEATIDPRGAATSYRIEWGPTDSYGNVAATGTVPAGEAPKAVSAQVTGLDPATAYHYRVVAVSTEGGEVKSPDEQAETLDTCGFTDDRCLELVSRADKGPLASPGKRFAAGTQIQFQAAAAGSALAYTVSFGYPEAAAGDAAVYIGRREAGGWSSEQLAAPTLEASPEGAYGNQAKVLSSDLGCGVVASVPSLVGGAPTTVVEGGGANLYRRDDATGTYQLITDLPPVGSHVGEEVELNGGTFASYLVVGMSSDCRRVIFRTPFRYPGVSSVGGSRFQLYEWDDGNLRDVALIPGPGGQGEPIPAESLPGALDENPEVPNPPIGGKQPTNYWRAVSADGFRSVFTAVSRFGGDAGKRALFLSQADDPAVLAGTAPATDISQSETATPDNGNSRYWTSSVDGRRIFFTARYGLAANGSSTGATSCANVPFGGLGKGSGKGCDLYEYDAAGPAGERLTDLSPDQADPTGAGVAGVLDTSADGSYVYFAARGRLGASGSTGAENLAAGAYNIYLAHAGAISLVSHLGERETIVSGATARGLVTNARKWTSRSTADGKSFVFESAGGVLGGVSKVYLYSTESGTTVCVSCRRDGQTPFSAHALTPLISAAATDPGDQIIQPTVLTSNGRLYFYSFDPLAPGAVEGDRNLYQWEHGQVSLIATEPPGVPRPSTGEVSASFFGGVSADGGDVYFATTQGLIGGDHDGRWDVYDARVGGGFPEPAPPAPPCDAATEGACSSSQPNSPDSSVAPTSTFDGPGNPPTKKRKQRKKSSHRKQYKKKHKGHKKTHRTKVGGAGRGNGDRRVGK
jgi:hypothetical protein